MRNLKANSWPEFLELIEVEKEHLAQNEKLWYRGQSKTNYRLVPSLLRLNGAEDRERELFSEYKQNAKRLKMENANDWQYLIDMQHYGIPTRLLDWTPTLGIALTFAMYDGDDTEDSAIYLLNPIKLNNASGITTIRRVPFQADSFEYQAMYLDGIPLKPQKPIAVDCDFTNDRVAAQNGTFTVHGSEQHPFDDDMTVYGSKITLTASAKKGARQFLEHANLNEFSIYPDIFGMSQFLRRKYFS